MLPYPYAINYSRTIGKMKKLIALITLSLISLGLTGCADEASSDYLVDIGGANLFQDPNGRYSIIYPSDWYYFETTTDPGEKITTWHTNEIGAVTLGITYWEAKGPTTMTVLEWAQENRDSLIVEGYVLVQDISPIVNANGNTGYEFTVRWGGTEYRIAFFFNNLTEQFDLTFYYDIGNPDGGLTQIIENFKTTDL
jgi:hypothetical protein